MDYRDYQSSFGGIVLQEYSEKEQKLVGPKVNIFKGTPVGVTEGPHLYRHDGWYYLMTAEGGAVTHEEVSLTQKQKSVRTL